MRRDTRDGQNHMAIQQEALQNPPGADTGGATLALAGFIGRVKETGVPAAVRRVLQTAFVDAVGCGLFGLTTSAARIVQEFAEEQGGPRQATLWASGGRRVSAANAALAMGTAIHAFDFDDHHRSKIHPGAAVLPAVLALGEVKRIDGPTALAALAAGYEAMARVSLASNPNAARMRGWHLTGTCGTFGAAAAASVILDLDQMTTASALGLAGTQSAGLWAFNADGAMSKRLHPGRSAQSGIYAALLAQKGFDGPRFILETEDGSFLAAMSDASRVEEITRELGTVWRAEAVCFKPYSCCGSNHSSVDAALGLMAEHGFTAARVKQVIVGVSRVVLRQTGFVYRPTTVLNAQMSLRFNVAVALADGAALIEQFTEARIHDPFVCDLASRVDVEIDPEMDAIYPGRYAGIVTIVLEDGRRFRRRIDDPKGMPENPMTAEDLDAKFLSLAEAAVGRQAAVQVLEDAQGFFGLPDISRFADRLGRLQMNGAR
jgi:2-methylcitrate dehydratase PrpD